MAVVLQRYRVVLATLRPESSLDPLRAIQYPATIQDPAISVAKPTLAHAREARHQSQLVWVAISARLMAVPIVQPVTRATTSVVRLDQRCKRACHVDQGNIQPYGLLKRMTASLARPAGIPAQLVRSASRAVPVGPTGPWDPPATSR